MDHNLKFFSLYSVAEPVPGSWVGSRLRGAGAADVRLLGRVGAHLGEACVRPLGHEDV